MRVSTVPLIPRRDMRKLRGTYMDVTAKDHYTAENKMDYLQITLTDEEDVPGALQKLRTVYPNLMRLEYDNKRTRENREVQAVEVQEQKSELELFEEFYELLNNEPMKEEQTEFVEKLIQDLCWNEDRFIRGFTEDGEVIGQRTDPEANMWLNPQSWSVISGLANEAQADLALQNVYDKLNTEYGAILMDPPYHAHAFDGALAVIYNAGTKENAGIFFHSLRDGSFLQRRFVDTEREHLTILLKMHRLHRIIVQRSEDLNHTAMDSLQKENTARTSAVLMYTG